MSEKKRRREVAVSPSVSVHQKSIPSGLKVEGRKLRLGAEDITVQVQCVEKRSLVPLAKSELPFKLIEGSGLSWWQRDH